MTSHLLRLLTPTKQLHTIAQILADGISRRPEDARRGGLPATVRRIKKERKLDLSRLGLCALIVHHPRHPCASHLADPSDGSAKTLRRASFTPGLHPCLIMSRPYLATPITTPGMASAHRGPLR